MKKPYYIYEAGKRDIEHPFSGESFEELVDETEGDESDSSFEVDLRLSDHHFRDIQEYPFYYSKKGAPRGHGYPIEMDWWQKALSFTSKVKAKYQIRIK